MTYQVELAVRLKIPDVTALTAANAIRRRLGYGENLVALDRAEHYVFDVEAASAEEADAVVREVAQRTSLFVNPNKHVFETQVVDDAAHDRAADGAFLVRCLVRDTDFDPGAGIRDSLVKLGYGEKVKRVEAGTLWVLKLKADDESKALDIATDIAVTRARGKGLLSNPHYQTCTVY